MSDNAKPKEETPKQEQNKPETKPPDKSTEKPERPQLRNVRTYEEGEIKRKSDT